VSGAEEPALMLPFHEFVGMPAYIPPPLPSRTSQVTSASVGTASRYYFTLIFFPKGTKIK
jgi:hypothetical protein